MAYGSPSLTGSGRLILVPGKVPEPWGSRYVVIPLINVYDALITITSLTLTANSEKPLSRIYLSTTSGSPGTQIVYTSPSPYQTCNPTPCATPPCIDPPCRDTNNNLTIPTIPATWPASVDPIPCSGTCSIPGYSIRWIYFDFVTGTSLSDTYILTINFDAGAGSESTTITFTIP